MPRKIILDVDTGTDDAVAIAAAINSPDIDLIALTTVNGNRNVEYTTYNTLQVVEYLGADVPVYRGCAHPIAATLDPRRKPGMPYYVSSRPKDGDVHGDHLDIPAPTIKEQDLNAVSFIVDCLMHSDGDITLVPVGPLTNIATALRIEPRIKDKIQEIVLMGGGYKFGNRSPVAEMNIWADPEAAKIVFSSGVKVTACTLDSTHQGANITNEECEQMAKLGTRAGEMCAKFIAKRIWAYHNWDPTQHNGQAPIHDPLAVLAVIDPTILTEVHHTYVDVDFSGGNADGQTICEINFTTQEAHEPNAYMALNADRDKFAKMLLEILAVK